MAGSEPFFGVPGFQVGRSLRFVDSYTPELTRNFTSAGNRRTFTYSVWVKRSDDNTAAGGINHTLFDTAAGDGIHIRAGTNAPHVQVNYGTDKEVVTNALLRDKAAWYHIVVAIDTTQGTDTNRIKVYINSVQQTFSSANYPNQNVDGHFNNAVVHKIGRQAALARYFDGYMAEINFIDGLALGPTHFGTSDPAAGNGQWVPTKFTGTYGDNGFYLPFKGYGISVATGGTITTDGDYKVHSFTSNGTFEVTSITNTDPTLTGAATAEVEYLIIAGGGAGAADGSTTPGNGGGGSGGYIPGSALLTAQTYAVVVGAGGVGALSANAVTGGDSVFNSITADGGGGGGYYINTPGEGGGSGGGGGATSGAGGGVTTAGFGNSGEAGYSGGGGGGGGAGEDGGTDAAGQGGDGLASSITGSSVTRAGGGGGSIPSGTAKVGGAGGGGAGGSGGAGTDGSANTGSGGGAGVSGGESGSGGSGIVIIRYKFQ
jgi:hypothetical protein